MPIDTYLSPIKPQEGEIMIKGGVEALMREALKRLNQWFDNQKQPKNHEWRMIENDLLRAAFILKKERPQQSAQPEQFSTLTSAIAAIESLSQLIFRMRNGLGEYEKQTTRNELKDKETAVRLKNAIESSLSEMRRVDVLIARRRKKMETNQASQPYKRRPAEPPFEELRVFLPADNIPPDQAS